MKIPAWALFLIAVVGFIGGAAVAADPVNLVTGELLSSVDGVAAGKPFAVGILLKVAPGWHIYWKNPGDAGDPPRFTFKLPPGYAVSDVRFPLPTKFVQSGNIVGYGYKDAAVFLATVTPPKELAAGTQTLGVKVDWLCCQEVCKPGTSVLELSLPVKAEAAKANEEIFRKAQALIPMDAPPEAQVLAITPEAERPGGNALNIRVAIQWRQRPVTAEIFPEDLENLVVQDVDSVGEGATTTVMIKSRVMTGQTIKKALPLLVTYQDNAGRHGFYTNVELQVVQANKP